MFYIMTSLVRWTGKWVGSRSTLKNIRLSFAWRIVPIIWSLILWIPKYALFGQKLFKVDTPIIEPAYHYDGSRFYLSLLK